MKNISRPYIALTLTCIIWGTTYLVNKVGVGLIPPFLFATVRHSVAGICLLFYIFAIRKEKFPDLKYLAFQAFLGFLLLSIGNGIGVLGLKYIDSGLSAILAATSPILISFLTHIYRPSDKIGPLAWIGILLGFSGLFIICADKIKLPFELDNNAIGILFTLISIASWAIGSVISKSKHYHSSPLMAAGFQMIFASIPLGIYCGINEDISQFLLTPKIIGIWMYLIILGSLVAYTAYIYALKHLPAPIVSIQSYINPIIAMQLGVLFLNESLSAQMILGSIFTLAGVFMINYFEYKRKARINSIK
ncbi:MAG: EamA family transporter [Saprospiraceae bacterium]|nr:EamA family transporter [Saprospiraceae bacterium]